MKPERDVSIPGGPSGRTSVPSVLRNRPADAFRDARAFDGNCLLEALTDEERRRWHPALERVRLECGQTLHEPGESSRYAWFPITGTVSILYTTEGGSSGELGLVGNEGVAGWSLVRGHGTSHYRSIVVDAGEAFRVPMHTIDAEFARNGSFTNWMLRFTEAMILQTSRMAVCNRHHRLEQQLCRLLLTSLDRVPGREIETTHETLARRLGVRREGVTVATRELRDAGAIVGKRGRVEVVDRDLLETLSCECYAVVAKEYEQLLRWTNQRDRASR